MALPVAPLGSIPAMHLGVGGGNVQYVEPAWHKALTAFLANTAGSTGKDLVSNALARDYSTAATAQGLPGATSPSTDAQSFWSKVLHGPEWDKERYQEATRLQREMARDKATQDYHEAQLGIERGRLLMERARGEETAKHEARMAAAQEKAQASLDKQREAEIRQRGEEMGLRKTQIEQQIKEWQEGAPMRRLQMGHVLSQTATAFGQDPAKMQTYNQLRMAQAALGPDFESKFPGGTQLIKSFEQQFTEGRQPFLEEIKKYTLGPSQAPGATNSTTDTAVRPPSDNSQNVNRSGTQPSVPGGQPTDANRPGPYQPSGVPEGMPKTSAYQQPYNVQSSQGANLEGLPSAGMPGQYGQSSAMSATPPGVQDLGQPQPINQAQPLQQHVGQNYSGADLLAMVRPPQTPNSPTAIQQATSSNVQLPLTQDPYAYKLAALLARKFGTADGMGGTPMAGGSGGLPLGYG